MLKRCEDTNLSLNWERAFYGEGNACVLGPQILRAENIAADKYVRLLENRIKTTLPEKSSIQDSIGPPSTRMPMTLSPVVTFVNVKEKLRNGMRCHKTPSKFAKSLTSGALILWGAVSPSSRGTVHTRGVEYLSKWVEAKALPTNDARVVCKFLKTLFSRFGAPRAIISDRRTPLQNDQDFRIVKTLVLAVSNMSFSSSAFSVGNPVSKLID
ncbi:reverse transcriptase domain-containing protein [Tanacetum coccineum]